MNFTDILTVILLILASALCIALIYFNFLIAKSVRAFSTNFKELSIKTKSLIDSVQELFKYIDNVTNEIDSQLKV
jgi:biopolymer transport protein ExbB/TolQ